MENSDIGWGSPRPRCLWRPGRFLSLTLAALATLGAASPVAAGLVLLGDSQIVSEAPPSGEEAAFGERLDPMAGGILALGRKGFTAQTATLLLDVGGHMTEVDAIEVSGFIGGGEHTVVAINQAAADATISIYRTDDGHLDLRQEIVLSDVGPEYGSRMAITDRVVAVVNPGEESDTVDVFLLGEDKFLWLAQTIEPQLQHLFVDVSNKADVLAISGAEEFATSGTLAMYFRPEGSGRFDPAVRFDRIGGGAVLISGPDVFVQRNGYFLRPIDRFSVISDSGSGYSRRTTFERPGASLHASSSAVVIGNPLAETVTVYHRPAAETGSFFYRFLQSIEPPEPEGGRYGTSVLITEGQVLVGSPGARVGGRTNEGTIHVYPLAEGPVGCTIVGTEGDDVIEGTQGRDVICGLGGNDTINGLGGDDVIYGGTGDDVIEGNAGRDYLSGGQGNDEVRGGADPDVVLGDDGDDLLFGGDEDDVIRGGPGADVLKGGDENDHLYGGEGYDQLFGEDDDDVLNGGPGFDHLQGGPGIDSITSA